MRHLLSICIALLFLGGVSLQAQNGVRGTVSFENVSAKKDGSQLMMNFTTNLSNLRLKSQEMVILTPVLQSVDKSQSYQFNPIVITGRARMKVLNRELGFDSYEFPQTPSLIIRQTKKGPELIPVELSVPYAGWMRNATLMVDENTTGCASCEVSNDIYGVMSRVLPPLAPPVYELSYVTPPVEPVKQRSETHSAYLNFEVGKSVLLRDFKDNATVLNEVNKIVTEVRNDKNLSFTEFKVTGYASPEGGYDYNMRLSESRAKAFVAYMKDKEKMDPSLMKVNWMGEDWIGLRQEVTKSDLANKKEILEILDIQDINKRKAKLHALNGGRTYKILLDKYYPPLRRIDYTLAYIARPFDVNEAKQVNKTKPQYLSLNEMFLVANSYDKGSDQFKEVFDIAVRLYPTDPIAQLNTAALEIETGAYDPAISRLQGINLPEAWNNLGVAYAMKKDYTTAMQYFDQAAQAGVQDAAANRDELAAWLAEQ